MKLHHLRRGMRITLRDGDRFVVHSVRDDIIFLLSDDSELQHISGIRSNLTDKYDDSSDIMTVEDIRVDGYFTLWKRLEDKYYLKLPNEYSKYLYLNYRVLTDDFIFDTRESGSLFKTQFTLLEISNLPNQDFIQALEKELVE